MGHQSILRSLLGLLAAGSSVAETRRLWLELGQLGFMVLERLDRRTES